MTSPESSNRRLYDPVNLANGGNWFIPFAVVSLISIAGYLLGYSARLDVMHGMMPATATSLDHAEAQAAMLAYEPVRALFLPIRILVGCGMLAFVLLNFVRVLEPPRPFRLAQCLSVVLLGEAILSLGSLMGALFPSSATRFPMPPAVLSLSQWIESSSWIGNVIFGAINPFQVGSLLLMGGLLATVSELGKVKAGAIVLALTALSVFTQICLVQFAGTSVGLLQ